MEGDKNYFYSAENSDNFISGIYTANETDEKIAYEKLLEILSVHFAGKAFKVYSYNRVD